MSKPKLSLLAAFVLLIICLLPILKSGLLSDDLMNFQSRNSIPVAKQQGIVTLAIPNIQDAMKNGRFNPVAWLWLESSYRFFTTVASYKAFVLCVNIMAIFSFIFCLHCLRMAIMPAIWLLCFSAVIQMRVQLHDAFTSLNALYPLIAILIFLCLGLYARYLEGNGMWNLILSLLLYSTSLLLSEVNITVLLLLPVAAWIMKTNFKEFIKTGFLYFAITSIYIGGTLWLRSQVNTDTIYSGLQTNFDLSLMAELLNKQLFAALPLSNLYRHIAVPIILMHQLQTPVNFASVLVIVIAAIYVGGDVRKNQTLININMLPGLVFSLALYVIPALFILPSIKYQDEVHWGYGYLPVYIQNFGSSACIACVLQWLLAGKGIAKKGGALVLFVFVVAAANISLLFNSAFINVRSYYSAIPGQVLYDFAKEGNINQCEDSCTIVLANNYIWSPPFMYIDIFKNISGKHFTVRDSFEFHPYLNPLANRPCYLLQCSPNSPIASSLYKINCYTMQKTVAVAKKLVAPGIELIPEEAAMNKWVFRQ